MKKYPTEQNLVAENEYLVAFKGSFTSALRWHHLDELWQRVTEHPEGWYIYPIGELPPQAVVEIDELKKFVTHMDELLRQEHDEDYCGIVYADNLAEPTMVKIYDPNNLGVSCGYSDNPPLPGWVLSRIAPVDLQVNQIVPKNRQRWWWRIFA